MVLFPLSQTALMDAQMLVSRKPVWGVSVVLMKCEAIASIKHTCIVGFACSIRISCSQAFDDVIGSRSPHQ